jgi:hypothetical protein
LFNQGFLGQKLIHLVEPISKTSPFAPNK